MTRMGRLLDLIPEVVFVACSMYLSAMFGWNVGEGIDGASYALGAICAVIAFYVARFSFKCGREWALGNRSWVIIYGVTALVMAIPNAVFDYSSAAVVREAGSIKAGNANTVSKLAKSEVDRLEQRVAELSRLIAYDNAVEINGQRIVFNDPAAYDGLISAAKLSRQNEEKLRGGCKTKCEAYQRDIGNLEAAKKNAENRQAMLTERSKVEAELVAAKKSSAEHGEHANPAKNTVASIIGWFHKAGPLGDNTLHWGANGIQLAITLILQIGMIVTGLSHGYHAGRLEADAAPIIDGGVITQAPRLIASEPHVEQRSRDDMGDAGRYTETRQTVVRTTKDGRKAADHPALAAILADLNIQYDSLKQN